MAFVIAADIDDLNVCYVLRPEENATSDLFHFSVEDNGETSLSPTFASPFLTLTFPLQRQKGPEHIAEWHFNKMLKDTKWLKV